MSVKDKIYQIVADNSLSVEEKYAKIQELIHGKGNGACSSSGGTGEGSGSGSQSGSSGGSKSGESDESGEGEGSGEEQDGKPGNQDGKGSGKGQGADQNGQDNVQGSGSGGEGEGSEDGEGEDGQSDGGNPGNQKGQKGQGDESGEGSEDGDSKGDSQDGSQNGQGQKGKQGQNQNQNQNGQQNQNQQGQQQNQDPEDWLKDLDLGKKQRYTKAKGDGSDDPIVNGLPPGEIDDDDDDDQQGGFGGQMPEEFDDYLAGKYIGIAYAKEVFKGHGVKPTYGYIYDIPDVDPMTLIESMLTESDSDTDIRSILSGGGDAGSQAEAIYKLLFPDSDATNVPEDLVMMRNGDVSLEDWGNDDHIISKELGDEIKREIKEMPNSVKQDIKEIDPEWGSTGSDGEVQERMKYIKKLLDPNYIQGQWRREVAKKYVEKFGARIEKNSEGIVDWKRSLADFIDNVSSHKEDGNIRQNMYRFSGIISRRKKKIYDSIGKLVIYADTSGSAYSFCSTMISEVAKMARDCDIEEFDIHLFTDTVYGEHFGIDRDTVSSEDFGFEDVQSGGTSLNNVYNHIAENYIDGDELDDEVSAIIIMTDVDGIEDSDKIDKSEYFKNILGQMMYLIFDPAEIPQRSLAKLLPKNCKFMAITPSMLRASHTELREGVSVKKGCSVLEAISKNVGAVKDKLYNQETDDEKRRNYMKRQNVGAMRDLGRLDQLVPEIFDAIKSVMPNLESVNSVEYFEDTEETFYIDDDLRVWIHKNFTDSGILDKLFELCEKIKIYKVLGNITIKGEYKFRKFPEGFPEIVEGKFILNNVPNLESLDNVPKKMSDYYINLHDSRRHREELVKQAEELGLTVEVDRVSTSTLVSKFKNKNESMKIDEAVGKSLGAVKAKLNQAANADDEQKKEYLRKTNIRAMRDLGRLDQLVPELFEAMKSILPEVHVVQSVEYFEDTEDTFYIDDDLRLWIHKDFSERDDVRRLIELCKRVSVFMIIGDVIIQEMPELTSFPAGFPKEIKGFFKLRNTFNLRNLDNAPKIIYGNEDPYIAPRSRFFSTDVANKYKESITDKQNRHVNVMDVLRQRNNTYESMNNTTKGAEIAKRFAIGQRYLNEEFPGSMNKIFRTKFPQEPKYSDMLDEPDREDFPEGEEGERKFIGAQKRYDAIKAKREKRQRRYEEELEEYNKMQPLVRKNKEIFHDVISPIMEINWDDIKDSDIKVIRDYPGVLKDLKDNKKSFKGLKLFTDAKGLISLVYAKTRNDDECRIVFFRNENGEIIQGIDNIEKAIRERKKIYNMVDDYLTKELNYTYNDFPEGKNNVEPVEDVFLKFLYWSLAKMNGSVLNYKGKAFKLDNVIYNPDGLTNDEFIDYCVSSITDGKMQRKLKDNTKFEFKRGYGKGTIDLRAVADSRGQGGTGAPNSISFANLVMRINSGNPSFNPAVYFSDTAIRAILLGLVIRAEDGSRRFTAEDIIYANRDELLQMAYDSMDVNIFNSSLKYMSYKEKDVDVSQNGSIVNTQGVLLLFPDLCKAEYVVKTDINQAILNNYIKTAYRRYSRAGMLSTIKNYDYDPKTGERVRRDIVGDFKKVDLNLTTLDNFKRYSKYFKEADFNDANDVIRDAYDIKYGDDTDAHGVKIANKKYKNYIENINSIKRYPDMIISEIVNNPDLENDSNLNMLIDLYGEIEDILADVLRYDPNSDHGDSVDDKVNEIKRKVNTIESSYSMVSDVRDPKKLNAIRGIISRSERQSAKRREAARKRREEMMNQPKFEYDVAPFNTIVDTAANDYASVKRILNAIDFAKADEDAIDEFGSKDELIRRVTKNVDAALGFARVLASSADGEKIASLESAYKELGEILDSIVGFNSDMEESDEAVTKTAMELEDVARKLAREAKKYSGTSSRQAGFTA
ncbi:MAG: hypothetical protein KIH03_10490 [Paludibacteraceae bacterium]|nr:hypothetical protein [Paludibacteraceae bacterium]